MIPEKRHITIVSFIGRPFAGKDLQAARFAQRYQGVAVISPGALLRNQDLLTKSGFSPDDIREINAIRNAGGLVPDRFTMQVMKQEILDQVAKGNSMLIFTGYPRSREQYYDLQTFQQQENEEGSFDMNTTYIQFGIGIIGTQRRRKRRWQEEHRPDDRGIIPSLRRQFVFNKNVLPVLDEIKKGDDKLCIIDARKTPDEVTARLEEVLAPYLPERKFFVEGQSAQKEN